MANPSVFRVQNLLRSYGNYRSRAGEIGVKGPFQYTYVRYKGPIKEVSLPMNHLDPLSPNMEHTIQISKNWIINRAFMVVKGLNPSPSSVNVNLVFMNEDKSSSVIVPLTFTASVNNIYNASVASINAYNTTAPTVLGDEVVFYPTLNVPAAANNNDLDLRIFVEWLDRTR